MKPLNLLLVASIGVVTLALGALTSALLVRAGAHPFVVTPLISLFFVLIAIWLLVGGRAVRRLRARRDTWVTPIGAARIAVLSRATAYVTSGCGGFLAGVAIVGFTRLWAPATALSAWSGLVGAITALLACGAAILVERWCRDSGSDDDNSVSSGHKTGPRAPEVG